MADDNDDEPSRKTGPPGVEAPQHGALGGASSTGPLPRAITVRILDPRRVWVLAMSTFTQLVRMRVFFFLIIFALVVAGAALVMVRWSWEQELKLIKDVGLGAMSVFAGIFAVAGTALLIPKDIEDRTLYTILSKPVPRLDYILGKLLGVIVLLAVSLALMHVLLSVVLFARQHFIFETQMAALDRAPQPPEAIAEAKAQAAEVIARQGLTWNLLNGTFAVFLKASVAAAVALFLSTFASSTLFTITSAMAVLIIGHLQAFARDYFLAGEVAGGIERLIAVLVAIVFPDFRLFDLTDGIAAGDVVPAVTMFKMTGLALLYLFIYTLAAHFVFSDREL